MRIHCDVCGAEIEKDEAIVTEWDGEPLYVCSEECLEESERRDIVRGPGREDDPSTPGPA